jgi:hypothetical protein
MRLRPHVTFVAVLALASVSTAVSAQDWTLDTSALGVPAQPKGKKAKSQSADSGAANGKSAPNAKGENRQFGELEGWSPGKSPPKPKDKRDDSPRFGKAPVNMNSNGGMGVGMPF